MTLKELEQLHYYKVLIQHEQDRLDELRASVDLQSPGLSDMPKAPGARDKIGDVVPNIVDQTQEIEKNIRFYAEEEARIKRFINTLPNARLKAIFLLRFVELLTWQDVADRIGGRETEYSVKEAVYRFLSREEAADD